MKTIATPYATLQPPAPAQAPPELRRRRVLAFTCLAILAVWMLNGLYMPMLAASGLALYWLADVAQWIVLPGVLGWMLARHAGIRPSDYGFGKPQGHWMKVTGDTVGVFITMGFAYFVSRTVVWRLLDYPVVEFGIAFPPPGPLAKLTKVYASVTAGVVESAFCIGVPWLLHQAFDKRASKVLFTLLTCALFAAAHWEYGPHGVAGAFLSSLFACFWYFQLRNLWPVAGGHALVDLLAFA